MLVFRNWRFNHHMSVTEIFRHVLQMLFNRGSFFSSRNESYCFFIRVSCSKCVKRCIKKGRTRKEKIICSDSGSFRQASLQVNGKGWRDPFRIMDLSAAQKRNWAREQTMSVSFVLGTQLWTSKNTYPLTMFDHVGNWCYKCKLQADKRSASHEKYILRIRKNASKEKFENFLTLDLKYHSYKP